MECQLITDIQAAIGPLWGGFGFRNWNLLLAVEGIVAQPYSFSESLRLGCHVMIGFPEDPGVTVRNCPGPLSVGDLRASSCRTFQLTGMSAVGVENRRGLRFIVIGTHSGERHDYRIDHRSKIDEYRRILKEAYPAHYYEYGLHSVAAPRPEKL